MKKSDTSEQVLSRRKALGRIGLFATAAYTVPAFATLSMAHAASAASSTSGTSSTSAASNTSGTSSTSGTSGASGPSGTTGSSTPTDAEVEGQCGLPGSAGYEACLAANGWTGFVVTP